MYRVWQSLTVLALLMFVSSSANAYLDPGTGSMILQAIIASVAFGLLTIKSWWYRLASLFQKKQQKEGDEPLD
tara:strand:+ start:9364 stop:9582 length:219 start_codon:yes stop_codon:yes gene_type:complete